MRERDKFLCQFCLRNLYHTLQQYTFDNVQVHHVLPMKEDVDRSQWYDSSNLLLVCKMHHDMCERGEIPREEQLEIVKEQEEKYNIC
ncbi:hypothetical protein [Bacillus sp. JJ1474]|uniref:hypothetical protein n=1 Tax=Bacillus sp. JJ1474 TaxID=3122955 RepID=UPI002FFF046D